MNDPSTSLRVTNNKNAKPVEKFIGFFKTMKKQIAYILLFLFSQISFAQIEGVEHKIAIKAAPLSLLDIYSGSSYRGGIEFKIKSRVGFAFEAGGYFKNFNGLSNIKGYILKSEIRYYFVEGDGTYVGLEYLYKNQSYDTGDSIIDAFSYYRDYHIDKKINCITLKGGAVTFFSKKFFVDYFFGIGIRFKNVFSDLSEYEKLHRFYLNDSMSLPAQHRDGKRVVPNFDMGIKIGFKLL